LAVKAFEPQNRIAANQAGFHSCAFVPTCLWIVQTARVGVSNLNLAWVGKDFWDGRGLCGCGKTGKELGRGSTLINVDKFPQEHLLRSLAGHKKT
jgi:hypothetical protein